MRQGIEVLKRRLRQPGLLRRSGNPAGLSAARDGDIESGFDLSDVFVERPAQIRQTEIVGGR